MGWGTNLKTVVKKYGRVAVGVHLSVSGLCFSSCYLAILSSVDVESMLEKVGLGAWLPQPEQPAALPETAGQGHVALPDTPSMSHLGQLDTRQPHDASHPAVDPSGSQQEQGLWNNFNLAKGGGAFAMAWLCNKALFPVRVPITIGLTPPLWRFLTSKGFRV